MIVVYMTMTEEQRAALSAAYSKKIADKKKAADLKAAQQKLVNQTATTIAKEKARLLKPGIDEDKPERKQDPIQTVNENDLKPSAFGKDPAEIVIGEKAVRKNL